jgi:hypothetical protein
VFLNLQCGQGLGFTGSQEIAFGLAPVFTFDVEPELPPMAVGGYGGGGTGFVEHPTYPKISVTDNLYSRGNDDNEIVELLSILFEVIE